MRYKQFKSTMLILSKEFKLGLRTLPGAVTLCIQRYCSKDEKPEAADKQQNSSSEEPKGKEVNNDSAAARLNKLLISMQKDDAAEILKDVTLPQPGGKIRKQRGELRQQTANQDVFVAAKRIAELIDGANSKKSEMELLSKLLNYKTVTAAADVTPGNGSEGELQQKNLADLMTGMKIERKSTEPAESRSEFVKRALHDRKTGGYGKERAHQAWTDGGSVNLFGAQPLGIFKGTYQLQDIPDVLSTWTKLERQSLKLLVTHPPENYFVKLARWTDTGRVWHFPIDNEQGMIEEQEIDFTEHIFLEQHLEPWCPQKGPLRHFMELVCVGLSKNPYITAKEKRDYILWYCHYFQSKKKIFNDLLKTTTATTISTETQAQLSSSEMSS